jgi:MFS family permease
MRLPAGMWYSMALFYDSSELGPAYAMVAMASAIASVLGGPVAAGLLLLDGLGGLHGWQVNAQDMSCPCL